MSDGTLGEFDIHVRRQDWTDSYNCYIVGRPSPLAMDKRRWIAEPLTFKERVVGACADTPQPTFAMLHDEAQRLIDELWRAGLRPTEGSGSAGSLAATERHLADLQRLVFKDFPQVTKGKP